MTQWSALSSGVVERQEPALLRVLDRHLRSAEIRITFKLGTHPGAGPGNAEPHQRGAPAAAVVRQNGLPESAASSWMIAGLKATNGSADEVVSQRPPCPQRGSGRAAPHRRCRAGPAVRLPERAMRTCGIPPGCSPTSSMGDLSDAIIRQNAQIAPGRAAVRRRWP